MVPETGWWDLVTGVAQYLLVIRALSSDGSEPVSTGQIAAALDRSPAAATETVQRLAAAGLVEYEPYAGASLTAQGRAEADDLWTQYRVLCRVCRDVLELDAYEREALNLAGIVSADVVERMERTLLPVGDLDGQESGRFELPVTDS